MDVNHPALTPKLIHFGQFYRRGTSGEPGTSEQFSGSWIMILILGIVAFAVVCPFFWMCHILMSQRRSRDIAGNRSSSVFERLVSRFGGKATNEVHGQRRGRLTIYTIEETGVFEEVGSDSSSVETESDTNQMDTESEEEDGAEIVSESVEMKDMGIKEDETGPATESV